MRHQSAKTAVAVAIGSLVLTLVVGGCSRTHPDPVLQEIKKSHLPSLVLLYSQYTAQLAGKPATEADFKAFVNKAVLSDQLEKLNVSRAEDLFVSERDQKPYVLVFGAKPSGPPAGAKGGAGAVAVFAYEQEGKNGKRFVAHTGRVEEVDEARLKQMVPGAK